MNNARRAIIAVVAERVRAEVEALEVARDGEQEAYDNMPEAIQAGERGDKSQEAVSQLEEALDALQSAIDALDAIE